ncbi:MAG: beta-ketoacyl synthase chain length factor [Methylococcales symbiont of Hymedesmia sp. n. MRB-2018]|nr:MAG: beta-ketoacyl synthase chain length factor [Methylococcales symbiont of Hymedesmia sp. n. MRB-2018]
MQQQSFIIQSWSVWPPLSTEKEMVAQSEKELLQAVPKMFKRRLSPLAKTVFCAALSCETETSKLPIIFSSTHGELAKSLAIMEAIEAGEEVSPTLFSLSVHNAIAGLFSIAFNNKNQITVLAAGEEGMASAFIEALGLFQEGEKELLLIFYDEPLPGFFPSKPYQVSAETCAIALKLTVAGEGQKISFKQASDSARESEQPIQILQFIEFLSDPSLQQLKIKTPRHSWYWGKDEY